MQNIRHAHIADNQLGLVDVAPNSTINSGNMTYPHTKKVSIPERSCLCIQPTTSKSDRGQNSNIRETQRSAYTGYTRRNLCITAVSLRNQNNNDHTQAQATLHATHGGFYASLPSTQPVGSPFNMESITANCRGHRVGYRNGRRSKRLSSGEYSSAWYEGVSVVILCRFTE